MRKFLVLLILATTIFWNSSIFADTFEPGTRKTILVPMKGVAVSGLISSNLELTLESNFTNKQLASFGNKFVVYGLNKDPINGSLKVSFLPQSNSDVELKFTNLVATNALLESVPFNNFTLKFTSVNDKNGDGVLDIKDVEILVKVLLENNQASILEIQSLINKILNQN